MLESGRHSTIAEIASAEKINESYVGQRSIMDPRCGGRPYTRGGSAPARLDAIFAPSETSSGQGAAAPSDQCVRQIGDRREVALLCPDPVSDRDIVRWQLGNGHQLHEVAACQFASHK